VVDLLPIVYLSQTPIMRTCNEKSENNRGAAKGAVQRSAEGGKKKGRNGNKLGSVQFKIPKVSVYNACLINFPSGLVRRGSGENKDPQQRGQNEERGVRKKNINVPGYSSQGDSGRNCRRGRNARRERKRGRGESRVCEYH